MPPEPLFGPLQPLVDDPACQEVRIARYDRVLVRRRGRVMQVAGIRFADDPAVRRFVEQLTGCSTATLSSLVHPLPGDALLVGHFPPRSTHVTLSLFRPGTRPGQWEELVERGALPAAAAHALAEAVQRGTTILIAGPPASGKRTLLNTLLATLPPTARVAVIDESRSLTTAPSSARVVLPSGPSQPHAGATLVAEALRRGPAWVVLASILLDEWPTLVRAIAASGVRGLATVPVADALEPATLVEDLALHLTTAGVELDEARQALAQLAPLVVLTETLPAAVGTAERWRVRGIVGLGGAPGGPEVVALWQLDPATGRLAATGRVFEPPPRPATAAAPVPVPPSPSPPSGSGVAAEDPSVDVFGGGLGTTRLVREWVRPDEPFLPIPAGESCPACAALDAAVAASAGAPEKLRAARYRRALHRGLHAEVVLLLERLLKPRMAAAYRDPPWLDETGQPLLREPRAGDTMASQVFFVLHRHRFGQFVSAALDPASADEPRLRLRDERGQILELRGCLGGYRGQAPRGTIWILRVAGVEDYPDRMDAGAPMTSLEAFVFAHDRFTLTRP